MDTDLNDRLLVLKENDPRTKRYVLKSPFKMAAGSLPYDQRTQRFISYEKLRKVRVNAKFQPHQGHKERGDG